MGAFIVLVGYTNEQIDTMMPELIRKMNLGPEYQYFSVLTQEGIRLYGADGKFISEDKHAIILPAFKPLRENPQRLGEIATFFGHSVTMINAEPILGTKGGAVY